MKFVMDERVKHRLTGLVLVISMAVIFLPAVMKKSNHRLDENIRVSLKLPNKPHSPQVAIPTQEMMFESLKVAHVEIPALPETPHPARIAKAEPLMPSKPQTTPAAVVQAQVAPLAVPTKSSMKRPLTRTAIIQASAPQAPTKNTPAFAVQLASFTQQQNAQQLVARLRQHGFQALYHKVIGRSGTYYQVLVGHTPQKMAAVNLQKQLVNNMRLHGFVVQTAIG